MVTTDLKGRRTGVRGEVADKPRRTDDERERHREKENADERERREDQQRPALERAAADALHCVQHNRQHGRFQTQK
jgi:hypothetical protein